MVYKSMPISRRLHTAASMLRLLLVKFMDDRCPIYASALSFSSLLSIVPFLAIVFTILKLLNVHTSLTPVILSNVAAGSHGVITLIIDYIHSTSVASLGAVGIATLLLSVMATLDTAEDAFNQICELERGKAYHHKFRDYLIVIFSIPLLLALSVIITTALQNQNLLRWIFGLPGFGSSLLTLISLTPYLSTWIALLFLYKFIPNTRISFKNALIGSLTAGTTLQMAQWLYIHLQIGVSRYNAIYGTLALLPVFMIWIFTSWIIVLAGMQLIWYLQNKSVPSQLASSDRQPQEPL